MTDIDDEQRSWMWARRIALVHMFAMAVALVVVPVWLFGEASLAQVATLWCTLLVVAVAGALFNIFITGAAYARGRIDAQQGSVARFTIEQFWTSEEEHQCRLPSDAGPCVLVRGHFGEHWPTDAAVTV